MSGWVDISYTRKADIKRAVDEWNASRITDEEEVD